MTPTSNTARQVLDALIERFLAEYNDFYPHNASFLLGLHAYDGRVPDFSPQAIAAWRRRLTEFGQELGAQVTVGELDRQGQFDYNLLQYHIELEKLRHGALRFYERNPIMPYLYIFDVSNYLKRNYAPLPQRVESLCRHLEATPRLLDQLRQKLDGSLPRAAIEISLETFGGFARYYKNDLVGQAVGLAADTPLDPSLLERLRGAAGAAGASLDDYVAFFQEHLTRADEDFAIGPENYLNLLKWGEMVELSLEQLLEIGQADLRRNQEAVRRVCEELAPGVPVAQTIARVGAEHPTNDQIVPTTRAYMESIRRYLTEANLIDVPPGLNCIVDETPPFMRWIFADMETPGPFETVATEAHFYITPANPDWPLAQQEEWLSRFNHYVIQVFSLHEAYPGHYLQHLHARHSHSLVARNLTSYSFIEGWAHYCEQMMLEEGYGREDGLTYAKLRLAQLEEALVRDCRFMCSLGLHTQGWTVEQALKFYQDNAWLEEATARKEALRSTFDPAGLNYTLGKLLFYGLRADYEAQQGSEFNLREFHNRCLAYGMPPVGLLRSVLLDELTSPEPTSFGLGLA